MHNKNSSRHETRKRDQIFFHKTSSNPDPNPYLTPKPLHSLAHPESVAMNSLQSFLAVAPVKPAAAAARLPSSRRARVSACLATP
uniref:Uncharacterized protein n=1 Tax=Aegilops tauschii subsp. strangulata TaxID=200361 RepID=A0A452XVF0_AEGTS